MATGALSTTPRRGPGQDTVSNGGTARAISPQDEARIQSLLQAAGRAHQAGNQPKLQAALEEVLEIDPDNPRALYNLGILHRDRNDIYNAEVCFRHAIKHDPSLIDAYQGLADLLFNVKHLIPATKVYEDALERAPNRLPLLHNLARARLTLKEARPTEEIARRILAIDDKSLEAIVDLAWALLYGDGDAGEALALCELALALEPAARQALAMKEHALRSLNRADEADAVWQEIKQVAATDWGDTRRLLEAYHWLGRSERSRALIDAFIEDNPDKPEALKDLAALMMNDGEFVEAQAVIDRASELAPDNMIVKMVRGLGAFRLGDYKAGLELYEARWHRDAFDKPWTIPVPEWDGKPVDGRLIVYSEQGIGDYVMYAMLFPELRRFAKSVLIEVNPRMDGLFRRSFPDMGVVCRNSLPPNWNPKDYAAKVAMGDLPLRLGADLENLPRRDGFLIPEPILAATLRKRYQALFPGKRLVGISWRSGSRDSATIRSIDLSQWRPIFEVDDCAFISLQYGDNSRDLERLTAETGHVVHWDREIDPMANMDPFTSQIAAMDLVISVDNSTVHFAGAIGKPCWVMLPVNSDWRWLADRSNSIWYDSLQLFRQKRGDGWEPLIRQAADQLRAFGVESLTDAIAQICLRGGEELLRRGAMAQAEAYFRWLLETGRSPAVAMHGIGLSAQKAQHFQDAAGILGRAVELAPERVEYRADWAVALFDAGHREIAERLARDLTRQSSDPTAAMAMGQILAAKGQPDQATDYFARVLRTDPAHVMARYMLANLQAAQGEDQLARQNFTRLLAVAPDLPVPRTALAEHDLRHGRDEAARGNFAWRFGAAPDALPPHLAMIAADERPKSWSEGRIRKRRLFLRAERSAMEQLLFAPWLAEVAKDSRMVLAECDAAVRPLLAAAFPKIQFADAGSLTPAALIESRIQIASSLGDLVAAYSRSDDALLFDRAAAEQRCTAARKDVDRLIGLAWQVSEGPLGGLECFLPLFDAPDVRWLLMPIGILKPGLARGLSSLDDKVLLEPVELNRGLSGLAERLATLDLLISREDLVATMAGVMGRPVWKVQASNGHWSWLAEGAVSKWHPTARIFREVEEGAGNVVADLRSALMAEADGGNT